MTEATGRSLAARAWNQPLLVFLIPPICWTGNILIGRAFADDVPPVALAAGRWAIAILALLPFIAVPLYRYRKTIFAHLPIVIALGAFGIAGYNALVYVALSTVPALNVAVINSTIPLTIPVFAWILLGQRPGVFTLTGLALSSAGVLWITSRGNVDRLLALEFGAGDLWTLASVINWALYSVMLRFSPPGLPPLVLLAANAIAGLALLLPFLAWELASGRYPVVTPATLAIWVYLGLFASLAAFSAWMKSVSLIGPTRTGLAIHLLPPLVAIGGTLVLDETILAYHLVGAALILLGLLVAHRDGR